MKIRYKFEWPKWIFFETFFIEAIENWWVSELWKDGTQILERDEYIWMDDKLWNNIFVNDIIKETHFSDITYYQIIKEWGSFYAEEIKWINFNKTLEYWSTFALSKFTYKWNAYNNLDVIWNIHDWEE